MWYNIGCKGDKAATASRVVRGLGGEPANSSLATWRYRRPSVVSASYAGRARQRTSKVHVGVAGKASGAMPVCSSSSLTRRPATHFRLAKSVGILLHPICRKKARRRGAFHRSPPLYFFTLNMRLSIGTKIFGGRTITIFIYVPLFSHFGFCIVNIMICARGHFCPRAYVRYALRI